jgi:hypothetical protein
MLALGGAFDHDLGAEVSDLETLRYVAALLDESG